MYRGTTPTIQITISGVQISTLTDIWVTLEQKYGLEMTKKLSAGEIYTEVATNKIRVPLTQEDTLKLKPGTVDIQIRALTNSGGAVAGPIKTINVDQILKDGVIGNGND